MKVLVAIKRVIDHNINVRINHEHTNVDLNNVKMTINPFCEIAVEEAIRIKEKGLASEIVVITIGPKLAEAQLRFALAMGMDRAIHIVTNEYLESLIVAKLLKCVAKEENPDIILLGKQSIDTDNSQTGQMLSALLNWSQGTCVSNIEIDHGICLVTCETDYGLEILSLKLPAIVTVDLGLNKPRYARISDILEAKKKKIDIISPNIYGIDTKSHTHIIKVIPYVVKRNRIKVSSVDELIYKLKKDVKVI